MVPGRAPGRRAVRGGRNASLLLLAVGLAVLAAAAPASGAAGPGHEIFPADLSSNSVCGEKPQSKLWYHDGSWWAVLCGPEGVAIYEKLGTAWYRGAFVDAVLGPSGNADVKWNGSWLGVLVYSSSPKYFEYAYDAALRVWNLAAGFPVEVPRPSGAETMVLEVDSTGRLWAAAEGNTSINVYYTTSSDHRTWSKTPIVLRTGVTSDDIASILAFGDCVGVFWSDQARDEFGFRVHRDADPAAAWQPLEIAGSGAGHADDHINLAGDSRGRVYALTKDDFDRHALHRREADGTWTLVPDVTGGPGTRGIVMVSDADDLAYVLWTRWDASPDRIEYRSARLGDLRFGTSTILMAASSGMNNVTGTKQVLPAGNLVAVAEGAGRVWWNGWGVPVPATLPPPGIPVQPVVRLLEEPARAELAWSPPAEGPAPDGYFVYRSLDGGPPARLGLGLLHATSFTDTNLVAGTLCYTVTAFANHQEGAAAPPACLAYAPPPPAAPQAVTATAELATLAAGAACYTFDAGAGQTVDDATGHGHTGQLGSATGTDTADPVWVGGVTGAALRFDGSNDRVRVADSPDLRFGGSFTVESWLQRAKIGTAHCVASKGDSGRRNFWVEIDAQNRLDFRWETAGGTKHGTTSTTGITDALWHHVACVYDQQAGEDRIYLDGVLVARASDAGVPATSSDPLLIGAKLTAGSIKAVFKGGLDLVRVAPGALYTDDFAPPLEYTASASQTVIRLEWEPPASGSVTGYQIERRGADGTFTRLTPAAIWTTTWSDLAPPAAEACYRVLAVDLLGREGDPSEPVCAAGPVSKARAVEPDAIGRDFGLAVGPNPFNPSTTIRFRMTAPGRIQLRVYDVRGARVATIADEPRPAGEQVLRWNADAQLASGTYFVVLRAGGVVHSRRVVLVK